MAGLMRSNLARPPAVLAWAAALVWACSLLALGAQLEGYSQWLHPIGLPGASGLPGAWPFNAMVFVLPGLSMALLANGLRDRLPADAGWWSRQGCNLALLSALAFAGQGMAPLDPDELDAGASRWHAALWTVWWIAFAAGLLALSLSKPQLRLPGVVIAIVLLLAVLGADLLGAAPTQRIATLAWFAWMAWVTSILASVPADIPSRPPATG